MAFHPCPKDPPQVVTRYRKRVDADAALKEAYAEVDQRDGGICWVTGRYTIAGGVDARTRREHHHLKGRNVKPEWVHEPQRIITVTAEAHALITAGYIVVEGVDANTPIFMHWAAHVKPEQKPFRLAAARRRAQE